MFSASIGCVRWTALRLSRRLGCSPFQAALALRHFRRFSFLFFSIFPG
jgi:hypothetical protein